MARRNMRMEEYLELVYQWHRGRSIRQIRDSLVTQLFFCNLTESDLKQDSPVG